jgi:phosphoribosylamine--glycine ligase
LNVLIIGSGAREHTLTWSFSKSRNISEIFIAPGNAGTEEIGNNLPDINPLDFDTVVQVCRKKNIKIVVIGPEDPLAAGIVDRLQKEGIKAIGPNARSAQLESSKTFSKEFLNRHHIPTAKAKKITNFETFKKEIDLSEGKIVIKKSGLAAGKGVLESDNKEDLLAFGKNILENDALLIEEFLEGYELSVFALIDGKDYKLLPPCADFKKAGEGDIGPNTGGMGSICPVAGIDNTVIDSIDKQIVMPTIDGLKEEKLIYKGVLYFGLMMTKKGAKVLEFNARFGDPETQVLLPLIQSDITEICEAIISGTLKQYDISISEQTAAGVIVASKGYPDKYPKGLVVSPIPTFPEHDAHIFHASTKRNEKGQVVTGGGRCFTAVGINTDLVSATKRAYETVKHIKFEGAWYRKDIAKKFFNI